MLELESKLRRREKENFFFSRGARDRERGRTWGEITGQREEGTHRGVALEGADIGTCFYKLSVLPCTYHFVKFFWISKGAVLKVN